jgi:hypothetical protein
MSSKLFAFQLSRPAESTGPMSREYDPQTQTMVWQGGTLARAEGNIPNMAGKTYCTHLAGGANWCKIIGVGCFLGSACIQDGWNCDAND